ILSVHVFHRKERVPLKLADVVHAADVRMRHLPRHAHFGVELRQPRRVAIHLLGQELQRDRLAELQVVGAIDLAHAAAPEPSDDAIPVVEDRSRREPPVIDRLGFRQPRARPRAARAGIGSVAPGASTLLPGPGASALIPGPGASALIPGPGASALIPGPGASALIPGPGASALIPCPVASAFRRNGSR